VAWRNHNCARCSAVGGGQRSPMCIRGALQQAYVESARQRVTRRLAAAANGVASSPSARRRAPHRRRRQAARLARHRVRLGRAQEPFRVTNPHHGEFGSGVRLRGPSSAGTAEVPQMADGIVAVPRSFGSCQLLTQCDRNRSALCFAIATRSSTDPRAADAIVRCCDPSVSANYGTRRQQSIRRQVVFGHAGRAGVLAAPSPVHQSPD
jgi:hypothetical protein